MNLFCRSKKTENLILLFDESCKNNSELSLLKQKMSFCQNTIWLISIFEFDKEKKQYINDKYYDRLANSWIKINQKGVTKKCINQSWEVINSLGESLFSSQKGEKGLFLYKFRNGSPRDLFFLLLNGNEPFGLRTFELTYLCNYVQIFNNRIPLHASAIIHNQGVFLFSGPSGYGKSTIASMSDFFGDIVIDEDQVLIYLNDKGNFVTSAWGNGIEEYDVPIKAIFFIIQDQVDKIIELDKRTVARRLLERNFDIMPASSNDRFLQRSFSLVSEISRKVPGFELHFRKSHDFWKLIDAEFELD